MAGLSPARLERMRRVLSGYVERRELPGLVALVARGDDVHVQALGTLDFGEATPMARDTIFRIASITKLVTAVAAMILVRTVACGWTIPSTRGSLNWPTGACCARWPRSSTTRCRPCARSRCATC